MPSKGPAGGDGLGIRPPELGRVNDPRHWRDRAEEARIMASEMKDFFAIQSMLRSAEGYDRLTEMAETRLHELRRKLIERLEAASSIAEPLNPTVTFYLKVAIDKLSEDATNVARDDHGGRG
jgi:hypothetical protein